MDSLYSIVSVCFVLALLGGFLAILRRRGNVIPNFGGGSKRDRQMEVTERLTIGPQHALHMVRIGDRSVVVATHPNGCQILLDRGVTGGAEGART